MGDLMIEEDYEPEHLKGFTPDEKKKISEAIFAGRLKIPFTAPRDTSIPYRMVRYKDGLMAVDTKLPGYFFVSERKARWYLKKWLDTGMWPDWVRVAEIKRLLLSPLSPRLKGDSNG